MPENGSSPRKEFAERIALLYATAGNPPLKRVAQAAQMPGVSPQRISDWRSGRNVPARFPVLHVVLRVLIGEARKHHEVPPLSGLYDLHSWRELWQTAAASPLDVDNTPHAHSAGGQSGQGDSVCPYQDLTAFTSSHAHVFFGRDNAIQELLQRITETPTGTIIPLIGASGSGKTSLLMAGIFPALSETQLSEIFLIDLCDSQESSTASECNEITLLHPGQGKIIVAGVRPDHVPHLEAAAEHLGMPIADPYFLTPLTPREFTQTVVSPAQSAGLFLEPGLLEFLVRDIPPTSLPLLSRVLTRTWQERQSGKLTIAGYHSASSLTQVLPEMAEHVWAHLNLDQRSAARQILMRLVHLVDDNQDTARRAPLAEILDLTADQRVMNEALEALVAGRVVTIGTEFVELIHDDLVHTWPQFTSWLDTNRDEHLLARKLEADAVRWVDSRRDAALVYRGQQLTDTLLWAQSNHTVLTGAVAEEFLAASQQRARAREWLRNAVTVVIAVLAVIALASTVFAVRQWSSAVDQRDQARFDEVLQAADRLQHTNPTVSALLDLAALRDEPQDPTVQSRILATQSMPLARSLQGHTASIHNIVYSPDGTLLASASRDHSVWLWEIDSPQDKSPTGRALSSNNNPVVVLDFSRDNRRLCTATEDGYLSFYDLSNKNTPTEKRIRISDKIGYVSDFAPDCRAFVTAQNNELSRWTLSPQGDVTPLPAVRLPATDTAKLRSVAYSPDGLILATGRDDRTIELWDARTLAPLDTFGVSTMERIDRVSCLTFSPNGKQLATGSDNGSVRLWDISHPREGRLLRQVDGHIDPVRSLAFNKDGTMLSSGSLDGTVQIWSVLGPFNFLVPLGQPISGNNGGVLSVAFNPSSTEVATGGDDTSIHVWSLPPAVQPGHSGPVDSILYSADGKVFVSRAADNTIRIWDSSDPFHLQARSLITWPGDRITLSPDGKLLASGNAETGEVQLWDITDLGNPQPSSLPIFSESPRSFAIAINQDSTVLATGHSGARVQLWDIKDIAHPVPMGEPLGGFKGRISAVKFSPNNRSIAVSSMDGTFRMWDLSNPLHPELLSLPEESTRPGGITTVKYSSDSAILAAGGEDHDVQLWDISNLKDVRSLGPELTGHTGSVRSIAFNTSGSLLASGSDDQSVRLWDISDATRPRALGESIVPRGVARWFLTFDPRGGVLTAGGGDGSIRVIDLSVDHAIQRICTSTSGQLADDEYREHAPSMSRKNLCPPS